MVEIGERDHETNVVLVDDVAERADVAEVVDRRHERVVIGVVERRRQAVQVRGDGRRARPAERGDDVDALPRAREENDSQLAERVARSPGGSPRAPPHASGTRKAQARIGPVITRRADVSRW